MPPLAEQKIAVGVSSVQSTAFGPLANFIRVESDVNCYIAIGEDPTASSSTYRLVADSPEYLGISPGHKIAVIEA